MGGVTLDLNTLADEKLHAKSYVLFTNNKLILFRFQLVPVKKERVAGELFLRLQYTSPVNAQKNTQIAKRDYFKLVQVLLVACLNEFLPSPAFGY